MPTDEPLVAVLAAFEADGYDGAFRSVPDGRIECLRCHHVVAAGTAHIERRRRLEGVSDPDDLLLVLGLRCSHCGGRGVLVLGYGPHASPEDADVTAAV